MGHDFFACETPDGRMGVREWGDGLYYVPGDEDGFQWDGGRRISPMSYAAFGEDAENARRNHDAWLAAAKEAAGELLPAG